MAPQELLNQMNQLLEYLLNSHVTSVIGFSSREELKQHSIQEYSKND
jgi:hypothetical protein